MGDYGKLLGTSLVLILNLENLFELGVYFMLESMGTSEMKWSEVSHDASACCMQWQGNNACWDNPLLIQRTYTFIFLIHLIQKHIGGFSFDIGSVWRATWGAANKPGSFCRPGPTCHSLNLLGVKSTMAVALWLAVKASSAFVARDHWSLTSTICWWTATKGQQWPCHFLGFPPSLEADTYRAGAVTSWPGPSTHLDTSSANLSHGMTSAWLLKKGGILASVLNNDESYTEMKRHIRMSPSLS